MDKNNTEFKQYHEWLVTRSWSGLLYRKLYLYPKVWTKVKGRVLDVGCGIGDFVRLTKNAVGIDINPFNVEFCKKMVLMRIYLQRPCLLMTTLLILFSLIM